MNSVFVFIFHVPGVSSTSNWVFMEVIIVPFPLKIYLQHPTPTCCFETLGVFLANMANWIKVSTNYPHLGGAFGKMLFCHFTTILDLLIG